MVAVGGGGITVQIKQAKFSDDCGGRGGGERKYYSFFSSCSYKMVDSDRHGDGNLFG